MKTIVSMLIISVLPITMINALDEIKAASDGAVSLSTMSSSSENINPHHLEIAAYTMPDDIYKILKERPDLRSLNVYFTFFTDQLAELLPKLCPNVIDMNLDHAELTDAGVRVLSLGFKDLTRLNLDYNDITNESLRALGENCKALSYVSLKAILEITDEGVNFLIDYCPNLVYLNVSFTSCTAGLVEKMKVKRPNLIIERQMRPARLVPARKKSSKNKNTTSKAKK